MSYLILDLQKLRRMIVHVYCLIIEDKCAMTEIRTHIPMTKQSELEFNALNFRNLLSYLILDVQKLPRMIVYCLFECSYKCSLPGICVNNFIGIECKRLNKVSIFMKIMCRFIDKQSGCVY